MSITLTSKTLSPYDAEMAFKTATAFLRKSDLADYLMTQFEKQKVALNVEVSTDPTFEQNASNQGAITWNLRDAVALGAEQQDVAALLERVPEPQKPYISSQLALLHLLALACQQLASKLNFRDADATWPWLDEKELSANDIENVIARELNAQPLPEEQNWNRLFKPA